MTKKLRLPASRRGVMIYDEDWEFLVVRYGPLSGAHMTIAEATREIIHIAVGRIRAREQAAVDAKPQGGEQDE